MSQDCSPPSRSHDLLGALLGLFCAVMLALIPKQIDLDVPYAFYAGPVLVPMLALMLGALASLPYWWRLLRPAPGASWFLDGQGLPRKSLVLLLLGVLYPVLLKFIGLEAATLSILLGEMYWLGFRKPRFLFGIPLAVSLLFWLVFKQLLDVYFPVPEILYLFGV